MQKIEFNVNNILGELRQVMADNGLTPGELVADGNLHRCGTVDRPRGQDGAYKAYLDNPPSLWWKNFKTGQTGTYTVKSEKPLSTAERQAFLKRIAAEKAQREADQRSRYREAAGRAQAIWDKAPMATSDHPYLTRKQIPALGLKQGRNGELISPILNDRAEIQSLQFISGDGTKRFLSGGQTAGGFYRIAATSFRIGEALCICEGFATGASVHLATGYAVLIAFNAGNLEAVARLARAKHPDRQIIVCADNDANNSENTGLTKARAAAEAVNALLAVPPTIEGRSFDFNDLHLAQGLLAVRSCVEAVLS